MRRLLSPLSERRTASRLAGLLLLGTVAFAAPELSAQISAETGATMVVQRYDFSSGDAVGYDGLTLLSIPVAGTVRFGPQTTVGLRSAWARASAEMLDGTSVDLSGLTDTEISLAHTLGGDAVVLTLIGVLPSGEARHDDGEAMIAGAIASDLLPFQISNWGSGGGVGGSVAVARRLSSVGVGFSVGYLHGSEFEPRTENSVMYRPGNTLRFNAALDRSFGASKAALRVGAQRFSEDAFDGQNLFRSGNRWEVIGSWAFPVGRRSSGIVYSGFLHRDRGAYLLETREAPSQDLVVSGAGGRFPGWGGILSPAVDLRVYRRSDGIGQGYTVGIGSSGEWRIGTTTLIPSIRGRFGNVETTAARESGFSGVEVGLTTRFGRIGR